jgi:FkbM family methyltransferase
MRLIKDLIKFSLKKIDYKISKISIHTSESLHIVKCLQHHKIDLVLDIGANIGQYASSLLLDGYKGEIISFEPLSSAHAILKTNAKKNKNWVIYKRTAIGNFDGQIHINISKNSVSSSILPILDVHTDAEENSIYTGSEYTSIERIDTIVKKENILNEKAIFIKIDAQGFEWEVLEGAVKTLSFAKGIQIELSLVYLYKNQRLWNEILNYLELKNYKLWAILPGFCNQNTGQTLQLDAIFFKID